MAKLRCFFELWGDRIGILGVVGEYWVKGRDGGEGDEWGEIFEYGRCVEHVWGWGKNGMLKKL